LLGQPGLFGLLLIEAITAVPGRTMWLPGSQAHPAEIIAAGWILADHVIAATILLNGHIAFGTLLGVLGNPIGCFRILKAFFEPLFKGATAGRFMPILPTGKAKLMATFAVNRTWFGTNGLNGMGAIGGGTPSHQYVALHKGIGYELLITLHNLGIIGQFQEGYIVHQDIAVGGWTLDGIGQALAARLVGQVLFPAGGAKTVTTTQALELLTRTKANPAELLRGGGCGHYAF